MSLVRIPERRILTPAECIGGYPTPRGADGIGIGIGCSMAFGGRKRWTPASLPSLAAWYQAIDVPAVLERALQPVASNAGFETGDPPTDWIANGSAVLSSQGSPYAGSACMRVAGTDLTAFARQSCYIVGNRYTGANVWAKSDGTVTTKLYMSAADAAGGSTSTSWHQLVRAEHTCTEAYPRLYCYYAGAGYCEYDAFDPGSNLSRTTWYPSQTAGSLKAGNIAQATATAQWWASTSKIGTHFALEFDGTADHGVSSLAASEWTCHKAAGATIAFAFKPASGGAGTDTILDTCNATATNVGFTIDYDTAAETLRLLVSQDGTGTWAVNDTIACAKGASHYVEIYWSSAGYSLRVDGGTPTTGAITGTLSTNAATATLQVGRLSGNTNFYQGLIGDVIIGLAGTQPGAVACGAWLKSEYGL